MTWLNRHLVSVLFGLTLVCLLASAWLAPDRRPIAYIAAYLLVIAAIFLRAKRRGQRPKPGQDPDRPGEDVARGEKQ